MLKIRLNLRKVATIVVACLVVTTMFVSCDKTNCDNDDGGGNTIGKIDAKLVGEWECRQYSSPTTFTTHSCTFNENGTFTYSLIGVANTYGMTGNYTVSNGSIIRTNVFLRNGDEVKVIEYDWLSSGYQFEKHPEGKHDYLIMSLFLAEYPLYPESTKWIKQ
jgi:hypothetical protein